MTGLSLGEDMSQHNMAPGFLAAMAVLTAVPAFAADTPEIAEQKRQLREAYHGFYADGVCSVFIDLGKWQRANWPEGRPVVLQFLQETILPRYVLDPAAIKDKTPDQLEAEYQQFCIQTVNWAGQTLTSLVAEPNAEQAGALKDTMLAARFLGECQTVSELYRKGNPEHNIPIQRFVVDEVYAKDPKYRHFKRPSGKLTDAELMDIVVHAAEDREKEVAYGRDCDKVDVKFKEVFEQLKPEP